MCVCVSYLACYSEDSHTRILLYYASTYYGYRYVVIYALHLSTHKTPPPVRPSHQLSRLAIYARIYYYIIIIVIIIIISSRSCRCRDDDDASPPSRKSRDGNLVFPRNNLFFFFCNFFSPFPYVVVCSFFSLRFTYVYIYYRYTSVSWASADRLKLRTEISCTARATSCLLHYIGTNYILLCSHALAAVWKMYIVFERQVCEFFGSV